MSELKNAFHTVEKEYPSFRENFRLSSSCAHAVGNRAFRKKDAYGIVNFFARALSSPDAPTDEEGLRALMIGAYSSKDLKDRLLFLAEDAVCAALILTLAQTAKQKDEQKKAGAYDRASKIFSLLLRIDHERFYAERSEVHRILSERDYLHYAGSDDASRAYIRRLVYEYASAHGVSDGEAARVIREDEPGTRSALLRRAVLALRFAVFIVLFAAVSVLCGSLQALLLFFPLVALTGEVVRFAASLFIRPAPILSLKPVPVTERLVVVSTVLITKKDDIVRLAGALERSYLQHKDDTGVIFGLLCDLKDAKEEKTSADEELVALTVRAVNDLREKYGDRFCLFIRGRKYLPGEKIYSGWERKRGALIDLSRLLRKGEDPFSVTILPRGYGGGVRYLLTLDADTELSCGAVRRMYAAAAHPRNRPIVRNGAVVSGYGVLQPRMASSVFSSAKTPFATLLSGSSGTGPYAAPVFDFYQSVFRKGAFCGKGLIDLEAFGEVIDGAFPDGRVLSHDLLEGTRLRCGYMSELVLTDSFPSGAQAYYKRKHRWIRGDLQSLPFAFPAVTDASGRKARNPIDLPSKYMILSNAFRALTPIFAFSALVLARVLNESHCAIYLLFDLGYLLFPLTVTVFRSMRNVGRRFYSKVMQDVHRAVCLMLYEISALCFDAFLSLDALLRVIWRSLISHKKMLEWVTAGESERSDRRKSAFFASLPSFLPSLAASILLFLYSNGGVIRLLSLFFIVFPFVSYLLSLPYRERKTVRQKNEDLLLSLVRKSGAYYLRFVTPLDNDLPPDNYQETPVPALAHRTSPTNIGLYLLSVVCMHDLSLIGKEETLDRLERTLRTLRRLPKYRGHLYNWYDTRSLDILGAPYISTVDSGNYALCLTFVSAALAEMNYPRAEELKRGFDAQIGTLDFSFLCDKKKKLLAIGFDPIAEKRSENCYDLLTSEARSAYYFAVAKRQIPYECWAAPGRPVTVRSGRFGILSWSGTAFEYFMPALFLPVYENTLLYEALCFAFDEQSKDRTGKFWGRSESGYFAFDEEMNYQYKAFGCASLAIDRSIAEENVIAPYASFLTLPFAPAPSLTNIRRLTSAGALGEYGFYEAIDFTPARVGRGSAIIRSYMAHHVGMSIAGAVNTLRDGLIVRRIMRDKDLAAFTELLTEGIPCDAPTAKFSVRAKDRARASALLPRLPASDRSDLPCALLFDGASRVLMQYGCCLSFSHAGTLITPPCFPERIPRSRFSVFFSSEGITGALPAAGRTTFDKTGIRSFYRCAAFSATLGITALNGGFLFRFETTARSPSKVVFSFPLLLSTANEYRAHPAFAGLLVEQTENAPEGALLFRRRNTDRGKDPFYLLFAFSSGETPEAVSSFDDLPETTKELFDAPFHSGKGALRVPWALLRRELPAGGKLDLIMLCGDRPEQLAEKLALLRRSSAGDRLYRTALKERAAQNRALPGAPQNEKTLFSYVSLLLEGVSRFRKTHVKLDAYRINELWRYGISGDLPVLTFLLGDEPLSDCQKKILRGLFTAHRFLFHGGIGLDLVFIRSDSERYYSPAKREFLKLLDECVGSGGGRGGVRLLTDDEAKRILPSFSRVCLLIDRDCIFEVFKERFLSCLEAAPPLPPARVLRRRFREERSEGVGGVRFEKDALAIRRAGGAPMSAIYCGRQFGTLLTHRSLGFTWMRNAGEYRLTPFIGSETEEDAGEKMIFRVGGDAFDLCARSEETLFTRRNAVFRGRAGSVDFTLEVGVHPKYPVKILAVTLFNRGESLCKGELSYTVTPCLAKCPDGNVVSFKNENALFFRRTVQRDDMPFCAYLSPETRGVALQPGEEMKTVFLFGTCPLSGDRLFYRTAALFSTFGGARDAFDAYEEYYRKHLSAFTLTTPDGVFEKIFNGPLPCQVLTARLFGRTGFYQPGGAYGFRDQLQDAVCMIPADPRLAKEQIFRCAAHQYAEGDVQHWWHVLGREDGLPDRGVRTACSDDLLFLPYAVARYLDATGDLPILDAGIRYLSSPILRGDQSRYERPERTVRKEDLYGHCLRAFSCAAGRRDASGLLLMGSGDWNDGFSEVRGGSVWLTQFFILCLRSFLPYARPEDRAYLDALEKSALNAYRKVFTGKVCPRAYFPDGTVLGADRTSWCRIDLLPQAFAVFLRGDEKAKSALLTAFGRLWDADRKLLRLFDPPYDRGEPFPGYLAGYCPGFRENGGQYTHAALWGAAALLCAGENEKALAVLKGADPVERYAIGGYEIEPYSLAGDVSTAPGKEGRGGWSLYTGSAGWFYKILLCELLGYTPRPSGFSLHPRLSGVFPSFGLKIDKEGTVYTVEADMTVRTKDRHSGKQRPALTLTLDGKPSENLFIFDGKKHHLRVTVGV